jgi:Flp pilus assembly protein TadG
MIGYRELTEKAGHFGKRFLRAKSGSIAIIFALSLVPLIAAAGCGIDLARGMMVKARLAGALDAAALAVGTTKITDTTQLQKLAQQYFDANFTVDGLGTTHTPVVVKVDGDRIALSVTGNVPTTLLGIVGVPSIDLGVQNEVSRSVTKLRVALVLDNTGSMSQTDATGTSKISALKTATHQLLTQLQNIAVHPGDVQVSIVPFSLDVNAGTANVNANWIDWSDWKSSPTPLAPSPSVGPGSACPYTNANDGFKCASSATNDLNCNLGANNTCAATIPASGLICPSAHKADANNGRGGHFYNGCWDSIQIPNTNTFTHKWVSNDPATWKGCFMDRDQNNDTTNASPIAGNTSTMFPAENNAYCSPVSLNALSFDFPTLDAKVDQMTPNGSTNQTIGLAWGWQALTSTDPLNAPAQDPTVQNVIVLLSDGLNTQNRVAGDGTNTSTAVDNRMALACANAKAANVRIYTVLVMAGNSDVLSACATDTQKYFALSTAGQIVTAFNSIAIELANLHLSR